MAYNRKGYLRRAAAIKKLAEQHYEPERHDKCWKAVWRKHINPVYGFCYVTFLRYLKAQRQEEEKHKNEQKLPLEW